MESQYHSFQTIIVFVLYLLGGAGAASLGEDVAGVGDVVNSALCRSAHRARVNNSAHLGAHCASQIWQQRQLHYWAPTQAGNGLTVRADVR